MKLQDYDYEVVHKAGKTLSLTAYQGICSQWKRLPVMVIMMILSSSSS